MNKENTEMMYLHTLQELVKASAMSEQSSKSYAKQITSPQLKELVASGAGIAQGYTKTLQELLEAAGGQPAQTNKAMEGIVEAGKESVAAAGDPETKDAAIIATLQVALHYYIATYATFVTIAKHLGKTEAAQSVAKMNDWMKTKDTEYSELAASMS